MPSETFLRLPEEKRERFMNAAWEEFLRVPFEEGSVANAISYAKDILLKAIEEEQK